MRPPIAMSGLTAISSDNPPLCSESIYLERGSTASSPIAAIS